MAVVDDTGLGIDAAGESAEVGDIVTPQTGELLLGAGDGVGLVATGGLVGAHVETLLRGVHASDGEIRGDRHVGTHDEVAGCCDGATQGVLHADHHHVGGSSGQRGRHVAVSDRGGDAALGARHLGGDVGAVELDREAGGHGHGLAGVHRGDGEADRATHRTTDDHVVRRDGLQADVVDVVDFPGATGAAAEDQATRGRREGTDQTAGRGQLDTLPEDLDLAVFGQLGLELLPLQVLDPQAPGRIVEGRLTHAGIVTSGAVTIQIVGGVQRAGLHRGCIVGVGRGEVAERSLVVGATGPDVAGAQGHRQLGDELTLDADADAHDVADAARMVAGLPSVEADAQAGQGTFLGEVGLTGSASERRTVGGQGIVGADVVQGETIGRLRGAAADAEVALEGEGLDDQTLVEVIEHHGGALAALGVGDGEVTISGATGGTAAGTILRRGRAHFLEGELRGGVEVDHIGGGIGRAADQPGCRHPTQQVFVFLTHRTRFFARMDSPTANVPRPSQVRDIGPQRSPLGFG